MKNGAEDKQPGQLSELEQVKLENFALKHNALQQQVSANLAERAAYIRQVEAAHPGYKWEDQQGLVPIPAADPARNSSTGVSSREKSPR